MPQQPLPSFQADDNVGVTDQQPFHSAYWRLWNGHDDIAQQTTMTEPLATGPLTDQEPALRELQTAQMPVISGPLSDKPTTQSLFTALQATIQPAAARSKVVVIPAEKSRAQTTRPSTSKRLSPRVRLIATLVSLCVVLLITLLSLTPISSAQGNMTLASNVVQWVQQQQTQLTILAHTLPIVDQAPAAPVATTAPAPVTLPKSQYVAIAQQDAIAVGISPVYFVRQINQESGFNPYAVSPAGAEGIAQFEPGTAAGLGIDPFNPVEALNAAAHLMASYANKYGGNYAMALAAYNAGSGTVQYAITTCGEANWMNCLPAETQNYIYVIMGI